VEWIDGKKYICYSWAGAGPLTPILQLRVFFLFMKGLE
jgi:hypothetical protein